MTRVADRICIALLTKINVLKWRNDSCHERSVGYLAILEAVAAFSSSSFSVSMAASVGCATTTKGIMEFAREAERRKKKERTEGRKEGSRDEDAGKARDRGIAR